jgi:hypothetical protein
MELFWWLCSAGCEVRKKLRIVWCGAELMMTSTRRRCVLEEAASHNVLSVSDAEPFADVLKNYSIIINREDTIEGWKDTTATVINENTASTKLTSSSSSIVVITTEMVSSLICWLFIVIIIYDAISLLLYVTSKTVVVIRQQAVSIAHYLKCKFVLNEALFKQV